MIDENLIVFAQGMKAFMYDAVKKNQKEELYQHVPKNPNNNFFIDKIIVNQLDPAFFIVQINEEGNKIFTIKRKESYLNFPYVIRTYEALDTCFISRSQVAILHSPNELHIVSASNKDDKTRTVLKLSNSLKIKAIFSSMEENVMIFTTENCIAQYDVKNGKILGQLTIEDL